MNWLLLMLTTVCFTYTSIDCLTLRKFIKTSSYPPKSFKRSFNAPRILNRKPPPSVLHSGPHYVNHYLYCDDLDQHTLDHIKSTSHGEKEIRINIPKVDEYTGNKEFHVLHLPKDKPIDLQDIKLHLNLAGAHVSPELDLELNKNFDSFEVNLPSIKPAELDASLLPTPTLSHFQDNVIIKPLIQGQIPDIPHYNYKPNFPTGQSKGESLELPHIEKHPLEHDPSKSSYDTPGAVNSYGQPIHSDHFIPTNLQESVQIKPNYPENSSDELDDVNFGSDEQNYLTQLSEIHNVLRRRRQEKLIALKDVKNSEEYDDDDDDENLDEIKSIEKRRYPNHRYN